MDGQRFDQLTRLLAQGTPRRRVLRGIAGGALGLFAARSVGPRLASAQGCIDPGGTTCTDDEDCCQGTCSDSGVCFCDNPGEPILGCACDTADGSTCLDSTALCCPGATGGTGVCTSASVGCNPTGCADPGGTCTTDDDCCQGSCSDQGVCFCDNPGEPILGCTCDTTAGSTCGDSTALCCPTGTAGAGICVSSSVGCNPTGCADPGGTCTSDDDCCQGSCSDQGVCFCVDPSRPIIGCSCTLGALDPCGDSTAVCCASSSSPGGSGVCTSGSVGCDPRGEEDDCVTGTDDACADGSECCALPNSAPGGPGICIPVGTQCAHQGCQPAGFACRYDSECCVGQCSDDGVCFCEDPAEPARGCPCDPAVAHVCGDTFVCCADGDDAVCVPNRVGCQNGGGGGGGGTTPPPAKPPVTPPVATLPSTGVGGAGDENASWLTPAAIAGAGAAIVAGRFLRRTPGTTPDTTEG